MALAKQEHYILLSAEGQHVFPIYPFNIIKHHQGLLLLVLFIILLLFLLLMTISMKMNIRKITKIIERNTE